jgi:hypothetical protein
MPIGIYSFDKRKGLFKKGHFVLEEWKKASSRANIGRHHTDEAKRKISEANLKQGKVPPSNYGHFRSRGYITIHAWVVREKGRPKKCEKCGTEKARKYEWANIDHKYQRILADYIRLCTKCHRKHDRTLVV